MEKNFKRTNIYVVDQDAWGWAQYRSKTLGHKSVSEYLFKLIECDRENNVLGSTSMES